MSRLHMMFAVLGAVCFLWFALPSFTIFSIGSVTGMMLSGALFCYGIFYRKVHMVLGMIWGKTWGKAAIGCVVFVVAAVMFVACIETVGMVKTALRHPPKNTNAVVLGCSVKGERPSRVLVERLEAAYEYLTENEGAFCVLSGGQGPGEDISEAECMFRYLTERGIAPERLFLEDTSTNTKENLAFSMEILKEQGMEGEITIITSEFHEYRANKVAERLGIKSYSTPSHTFFGYLPTFYVRELYGILYYMF
ncbi:MAG: YdcF family protein [Roseburia sp.]|nr:YdcF family protein [Roseburia sp.]